MESEQQILVPSAPRISQLSCFHTHIYLAMIPPFPAHGLPVHKNGPGKLDRDRPPARQ